MDTVYAVCRSHNAGCNYEQKEILESGIEVGDKFRLFQANVGDWHTDVFVEGHEKSFNSVFFDFFDEDGQPYNIYKYPGIYYYF